MEGKMIPVDFPQSNCKFGPPSGYNESQVQIISAYKGQILGGSTDGDDAIVVAWQPSQEEAEAIANGASIFLTCIGGLPPHFLTVEFPCSKPE